MKHLLISLFLLTSLSAEITTFNEEYLKTTQTSKMKKLFVEILLPAIELSNANILKERLFIKEFFIKYDTVMPEKNDLEKFKKIAKKYYIKKDIYSQRAFMERINTIPNSLAIAQGAVESAWGKSRFAQVANNIFGVWTWGKVGIIPAERPEGKKYKIRIFKTLGDSVAFYMLNLNRHKSYKEFRALRFKYNKENKPFTGLVASTTMQNYSGIGEEYNHLLKKMILSNKWDRLDK
ncbi:MAG: mannosyl-glycoprotein endo-beta-N-acetylglucosamidase [Helicobacteraceae bacterium]|nr:mannosyl-glycoprotein endo-beta-N-acetylglucosamidase [Helicobacteraceae bacterium]